MYYPVPALDALSGLALSGQTLSAATGATSSFTVSAWPGTRLVEFTVTTQDVYVTFDGSAPTLQNGLVLKAAAAPTTWSINRIRTAGFRSATGTALIYGVPLIA